MAIQCENCGCEWSETDEGTGFYFESSGTEAAIGDFSSPKEINDAGEDMTFCPKCTDRRLRHVQKRLNEEAEHESVAAERFPDEEETAGPGDSDVQHYGGSRQG